MQEERNNTLLVISRQLSIFQLWTPCNCLADYRVPGLAWTEGIFVQNRFEGLLEVNGKFRISSWFLRQKYQHNSCHYCHNDFEWIPVKMILHYLDANAPKMDSSPKLIKIPTFWPHLILIFSLINDLLPDLKECLALHHCCIKIM